MINAEQHITIKKMQERAEQAETLLKQLANANRLMILCNLVYGEKTAGELAECLDLSQSALSQHLAKLREAGLVESDKRGLSVYYHICSIEVQSLLSVLHLIYCR